MSATIDGKNLNPVVEDHPSMRLENLEKSRLVREMEFLKTDVLDED